MLNTLKSNPNKRVMLENTAKTAIKAKNWSKITSLEHYFTGVGGSLDRN